MMKQNINEEIKRISELMGINNISIDDLHRKLDEGFANFITQNNIVNEHRMQPIGDLINYGRSKTLNENLLVSEQNIMQSIGNALGMYGYTRNSDGTTGYRYEGSVQNKMADKLYVDSIIEWFSDPHNYLVVGAVALSLLSMGAATPLLAGALAAGSFALELADVALYWNEGRYMEAGIAGIFSLIPLAQLARRLGVPIGKWTQTQVQKFIAKISNRSGNAVFSTTEKALAEAIEKNADELLVLAARNGTKAATKEFLKRYTGKKLLLAILKLSKFSIRFSRIGLQITAGGLGFVTVAGLGSILGITAGEYFGEEHMEGSTGVCYTDLNDEEKKEVIEEITQKLNTEDEALKDEVTEVMLALAETSDEEKNKQITEALANIQKELDALNWD